MGFQTPGSLAYSMLHSILNYPPHRFLSLLQGEPGKAGEKGLAGAPGLRVSVLLDVCGSLLVGYLSETGGVSP